ncbi:cyclophilin-like fold protein [Neorhizobium sp. DT-125]|uniref:cyclophilin-like fold protein n=1 Tax=Neorhizobium sp. DT-125 TaxID=3396163 RepID=UPI003F1A63F8
MPAHVFGETLQATNTPGGLAMRIEFSFSDQKFTASLYDSPAARELASMLPLDLTIEDYSTNEKIAYLPRKLTASGNEPFGDEAVGDLCYFAPWGNLAFFHADYHYSQGLVRLGRLDDGIKPLLTRGKFPLQAKVAGP